MPEADESAELRMLRTKAYGRGGKLSAEELTRLQELEGWGAAAVETEGLRLAPLVPDTASAAAENRSESGVGIDASPSDEEIPETPETPEIPEIQETPARRRWPLLAAASAVILAVGLGIGWGIWGWDSEASALTAAHSGTHAEIEATQLYDPGTVVPVAEQHGVVVWQADRSDGEELCVIITAPDQNSHGCVSYEQLADFAWPSATATVPEGEESAGDQITAGLISTTTGELAPFIQVWHASGWESQYSADELTQLRAVEAAGYRASSLSILGYDGDSVVWSTWENGLCVIAPTDAGIADFCADGEAETLSLTAPVDGITTRYVVTQPKRRPPLLTIYKDVDTGYYFGTDLADDDPAIDDTSGD